MKNFSKTIRYIIEFLLQDVKSLASHIHYTTKDEALVECKKNRKQIYIIKSGFFDENCYGTSKSMPKMPAPIYEGVRFFFGEANDERLDNDCLMIHADVIASAYFLLSRYEEYALPSVRDEFGRYPCRKSVVYLSGEGNLNEPLVDLYGQIIRGKLKEIGCEIRESGHGFSKIYFTHDIDTPFIQYSLIRMIGATARRLLQYRKLVTYPFFNYMGIYDTNPQATWDYMLKAETILAGQIDVPLKSICFIIATEASDSHTIPYINDKKTAAILGEMRNMGAMFGLHTSYAGAESKKQIYKEKKKLEQILGYNVKLHRNHYLRQMHPSDMKWYEELGLTDDFTTGFAEVAGFKLGTCHPVRFIDPADGSLHDIIMHPLLIMDGSLSGSAPYQMGLDFTHAMSVVKGILDQVWWHKGEVNILFHNGMFEDYPGNYNKKIYDWTIDYIFELVNGKNENM